MRVLVAYHISSSRRRSFAWTDGFAAGIGLLASDWEVTWHNVGIDDPGPIDPIQEFDFVLAKSNWGWIVDRFVRDALTGSPTRRGIAISGSTHPPSAKRMRFYDVLFYETDWYRSFLESHPLVFHAFGVNSDIMNPSVQQVEKQYDWLTVGAFRRHKRQSLMLDKPGSKAAVGDLNDADPWILDTLRRGGVTILDYMGQDALAELYGRVGTVYIPAELQGGGERAVMEARACGAHVMIEPDNPKLAEFVSRSAVLDHHYYADQLARGVEAAFSSPPRSRLATRGDVLLNVVPDRRVVRSSIGRLRDKATRRDEARRGPSGAG